VHFKDGWAQEGGGAVHNNGTKLTLESCIFSGNVAPQGGAVWSGGDLTIRGCTFYGNRAGNYGGAVCFDGSSNTLTLTGNLFYGNKASVSKPVVDISSYQTLSTAYNVVDVDFGTGTNQVGWAAGTGDTKIKGLPVSPVSFKVLYQSGAEGVVDLSAVAGSYPTEDFYGNSIGTTGNGAAGAVQESTEDGWYLELSVNNGAKGSVDAPEVDEDGVVPLNAVITPQPGTGYALGYWTVNGVKTGAGASPMKITKHSIVDAVFGRKVEVSDEANLGNALTKAQEDDVIIFSGVTPGTTSIELESLLPVITKSLTIEGNGVTLTTKSSWTADYYSQLLRITDAGAEVLIRGVHFKNGQTTNTGGAVYNAGKLILESCIFSGNRSVNTQSSEGIGGAVWSNNDLTIRGCTFYENKARITGGAVAFTGSSGKTLTLTGNLFYGNKNGSPNNSPVVRNFAGYGTVIAAYNVADAEIATGDYKAGWSGGTGDVYITTGDPLDSGSFIPNEASPGHTDIDIVPEGLPGFPATDFYGDERTFPNGAAGAVN
jgi:hypothetical protein